jgi:L-lactate dehydrogenase complex protein LldG
VDLLPVARAGDKLPHLRVSFTGAELAVAETGTLMIGGRPGGWGLASVLPWVHVVLVRADDVFADLPAAFARFNERLSAGERDWVWITGPSRTADIGHTLVMGAHGPNALRVLVLQ